MAGYIGSKSSVTLVDGYTEAEADAEFVTKTGDTMTGDLVVENSNGATINVNTGLAGAVSKVILHEGSTASPANGATLEYDGATNLFSIGVGSDISTKRLSIARDSGNVGIGTASPSKDLEVVSGTTATTIKVKGTVADGYRHGYELENSHTGGTTYSMFTTNSSDGVFGGGKFAIANADIDSITAANTRLLIDSSGNVGIGTSSPSQQLTLANSSSSKIQIKGHSASNGLFFGMDSSTSAQIWNAENGFMRFATSDTERMRIDSSGNVLVGTTTTGFANDNGFTIEANSVVQRHANGVGSGTAYAWFTYNGGAIGSITQNGTTSVSYNTSSDYRLKESWVLMVGASERVLDLKPVNFAWKADGKRVDGFLAHELADVVPEAVTGTKDAMRDEEYEVTPATGDIYTPATEAYVDDDGNDVDAVDEVIHSADAEQPETLEDGQQWRETTAAVMGTRSVPDYQGIDQSKLVPLLTAALQEALTEIASLKTRVEALEA